MTSKDRKRCKRCGFNDWGKRGKCKECSRIRAKEYYKKNKKKVISYQSEYQKGKGKENHKKAMQRYCDLHPERIKNAKRISNQKPSTKESKRRYREKNRDVLNKKNGDYKRNNREVVRRHNSERRTRKTKAGGSFTSPEWKALCKQYNNRCLACGKRAKLTADHVIPVAHGGTSDISNIQPLCQSCNSSKGTRHNDYRTKPGLLRWLQKKLF